MSYLRRIALLLAIITLTAPAGCWLGGRQKASLKLALKKERPEQDFPVRATNFGIAPASIAVDGADNLFIAAYSNFTVTRVYRVGAATGVITRVAGNGQWEFGGDGGAARDAGLSAAGIAVDSAGNLFIADNHNHRVRRVDARTGVITTVAGNGKEEFSGDGGPATSAGLGVSVCDVAVDEAGSLFIATYDRVRRVDASTGVISTVAGNGYYKFSGEGGLATEAGLRASSLAIDRINLFIADAQNKRVYRVDAGTNILTTVAGNGEEEFSGDGGPATMAGLDPYEFSIAIDYVGDLLIACTESNRVRRVDARTGIIATIAGGDDPDARPRLYMPNDITLGSDGSLFIADFRNYRVLKVDMRTNLITTVAGGTGGPRLSGDGGPAVRASFYLPIGMAIDGEGNLIVADYGDDGTPIVGNFRIRRIDARTGVIATIAGNGSYKFSGDGGPAINAGLDPIGAATDEGGNIFIVDCRNCRVRRVDAKTGIIATVAGNGEAPCLYVDCIATPPIDNKPAASVGFCPRGVFVDKAGNLYIVVRSYGRIHRVDAVTGSMTTVAGNGLHEGCGPDGDGGPAINALLYYPESVAVDDAGNIFIVETANNRIRRVDARTGIIKTIVGNGNYDFRGDGGLALSAGLRHPTGLAIAGNGDIFIADTGNRRVRRIDARTGKISTFAGGGQNKFGGDGGPAKKAGLSVAAIALDRAGNLFIADHENGCIRRVDARTGIITTVAGVVN